MKTVLRPLFLTLVLTLVFTLFLTLPVYEVLAQVEIDNVLTNKDLKFRGKDLTASDLKSEKEISLIDKNSSSLGTVIVFLSSKCPCSGSHQELLSSLAKNYPEFRFVGINSNADETAEVSQAHFSQAQLNFPVLHDPESKIADKLGALKTPHVFVFNSLGALEYDGAVTDSHVGPSAKRNYLKEALDDLKNKKPLRLKNGRALGCYIQRPE